LQTTSKERHHFLDNLKIVLIMLVVAHHAGQPYGGSGGWWYVTDSQQPASLGHFFTVNASFFMGLFFFISAYFLPASIDKKGKKKFLQDRVKLLGWPLLFGVALLIPVLMYIFHLHYRGYPAVSFWSYYKTYYLGMTPEPAYWIGPAWPDLNFGHLWFIENLLFYSLVYLLCTLVMKTKKAEGTAAQSAPTHTGIVLFVAALSLITFIVRIWFPIDRWIGLFGFIQMEVAHIPQYISFFVLGIMAYRRNWLQQLPAYTGKVWLAVGVILAVLCYLGFAPAI
jgi:glucans biosynthesis protein C